MRKHLLKYFLIKLLVRLPVAERLTLKLQKRIKKESGYFFSTKSIKITGWNAIMIRDLAVSSESGGYEFKTELFTIRIDFLSLLRSRLVIQGIGVDNASILKKPCSTPPGLIGKEVSNDFQSIISSVKKLHPKLLYCVVKSRLISNCDVVINNLVWSHQGVIHQFNILGSWHKTSAQSQFSLTGGPDQSVSSAKPFVFNGINIGIIEMTLSLKQQEDCYLLDLILNSNQATLEGGQTNPIYHNPLWININAVLDQKELNIKKSKALFGQLEFSFNFENLLFQENRVASAGIELMTCDVGKIRNSYKGFKNAELYQINLQGSLMLKAIFEIDPRSSFPISYDHVVKHNMILKSGRSTGFAFIEGPFMHQVRKDGSYEQEIWLNADNENYISSDHLPELIKKVFIFAEDRNFYRHKGIDPDALIYSFFVNLSSRKLAKGGSTITMQLARNLFLDHKKTIFRKLEEMVISFLIEEVYHISKTRIFEIYVNIIEFGPDVYGLSSATAYYFSKKPQDLTLFEILTLTYIIPRPLFFYEALLINSEKLNKNLKNYIGQHIAIFTSKKIIPEMDIDSLDCYIQFSEKFDNIRIHV